MTACFTRPVKAARKIQDAPLMIACTAILAALWLISAA